LPLSGWRITNFLLLNKAAGKKVRLLDMEQYILEVTASVCDNKSRTFKRSAGYQPGNLFLPGNCQGKALRLPAKLF
jgi:hypothetical protein